MANIAAVFGWSPAVMDPMPVEELMDWHQQAMDRLPRPPKHQNSSRSGGR